MANLKEKIECFYKISFSQVTEEAILIGTIIDGKRNIVFQYNFDIQRNNTHYQNLR